MTAPRAGRENRRALIILAIGVALALIVFIVSQLGGGDDDEEEIVSPRPTIATTTTVTTVAGGAPGAAPGVPGAVPVETFEQFSTKNPFLPLRGTTTGTTAGTTSVATGTGTTTGTGTGTTTGTRTTAGTTTGTTGTTATGGATATGGGSTAPRRGERVALLDVFTEAGKVTANVRVNDQVHKVTTGQTFATSFRVVSLDQASGCGRFVFGDDQFRLCKGEETLK